MGEAEAARCLSDGGNGALKDIDRLFIQALEHDLLGRSWSLCLHRDQGMARSITAERLGDEVSGR